MVNAYDIAWGGLLGLTAPVWLLKPSARRKVLKALRERMGQDVGRDVSRPAVMIHAVSLGEMNATRTLVRALAEARPDLRFVVSTTTETGHARGRELYGADPRVTLIRYPLDFSLAVRRVLHSLRPSVVVLMELEVWPNFLRLCEAARIPVVLINGRLTESSYRNYRRGRPLVAPMFRRLASVCAQDEEYAERFIQLGAPRDRVRVTGTMKFDTAQIAEGIEGTADLAGVVGLEPGTEPVWVCGSTGPGEESLILTAYAAIRASVSPGLRLVIVPRHPERFDDVAALIEQRSFPVVRRSRTAKLNGGEHAAGQRFPPPLTPVILGDTMGELRKFYALADVVFVGRSLVDLGPRQHGSDMIEPAALAKPVVVGPFTKNFADAMRKLRAADAVKVVSDAAGLREAVEVLLRDPEAAAAMGRRGQAVVRAEQGATGRHVEVILRQLARVEEAKL